MENEASSLPVTFGRRKQDARFCAMPIEPRLRRPAGCAGLWRLSAEFREDPAGRDPITILF
jgi:hypothetical protein